MSDQPAWLRIPEQGPIAEILHGALVTLEDLGGSREQSRAWQLDRLVDAGRHEDDIRRGYTGRFAMELLQNAHDAMAEAHVEGDVQFILTPSALLVSNQGLPFDEERIRSITRLNSSSKPKLRSSHHQIGYKGIGFTSVFEVSNRPQILSRHVGFCFDRDAATRLVARYLQATPDGPIPARYFPFAIDPDALGNDRDEIEKLFAAGAETVIRLPLREDRALAEVSRDLHATLTAETLLFLSAVSSLVISEPGGVVTWRRREASRSGKGRIVHIESSTGHQASWLLAERAIVLAPGVTDKIEDELWQGVSRIRVAAALPWSQRGPAPVMRPMPLYSYFPTDDQLGRGVLLHGDFFLDSTRRRIDRIGPGRVFTEAAIEGAARLAADLAESVGHYGARVLQAFAPSWAADGAGHAVGEALERALGNSRIARCALSGDRRSPREVSRLATGLGADNDRWLAEVLNLDTAILEPDDDTATVGPFLARLGCATLKAATVAEHLDLSRSRETYARTLALAERWVSTTGADIYTVIALLRNRRTVKDTDDRWLLPSQVERRTDGAPLPPRALRKPMVQEPHYAPADAFLGRLSIAVLDHGTGLDRLLAALGADTYPRDDGASLEALGYAEGIWAAKPALLGSRTATIGRVRVPVHVAHRREPAGWRPASSTYMGREWTGDSTLEDLYGPLGEGEFLAAPPGPWPLDPVRSREFFRVVGVAERPRRRLLASNWSGKLGQWRQLPEYRAAATCTEGHPYSMGEPQGWYMDRLDALLDLVTDAESATRFAHGLLLLDEPYGPRATVACGHSAHHRPQPKPVTGYQRWRLEAIAWVPVASDPGGADRQVPARAWAGVPRTQTDLLVPRARLRPQDALALGLVRFERPPASAVEDALNALAAAHLDLAAAPVQVLESAEWLLRRLETVVDAGTARAAPMMPALSFDGLRWSRKPAVPNIPGLGAIRGLDLLPAGRWKRLARAYGLAAAATLVEPTIDRGPRRTGQQMLTGRRRTELLAVLLRDHGDEARLAARLAGLIETTVRWLQVTWRYGEHETPAAPVGFLITPHHDRRGHLRPDKAELLLVPPPDVDLLELGRALAEYLDIPDAASDIAWFLAEPDRILAAVRLSQVELESADALLRRQRPGSGHSEWRTGQAAAAPPALPPALDPTGWTPPKTKAQTVTEPEPAKKQYVNLEGARFGPAQPVAPPDLPQPPAADGAGRRKRRRPDNPPKKAGADTSPVLPRASARSSEQEAVKVAIRYGLGLPDIVAVRDVQDDDKGWDLEFVRKDGTFIPVEVKGSSGAGSFVITRTELDGAREHDDYLLLQVVDLTSPGQTRMRRFWNLGRRVTSAHLDQSAWSVTGWRYLISDEVRVLTEGTGFGDAQGVSVDDGPAGIDASAGQVAAQQDMAGGVDSP